LITLLLHGKQTHIQSVATIVACKGKRRTTLNKATQKSKEIEGREEKLVCQSEKLLSFHQKAPKLLTKSLRAFCELLISFCQITYKLFIESS